MELKLLFAEMTAKMINDREKCGSSLTTVCMLLKGVAKKYSVINSYPSPPPPFISFLQGGEEEAKNWLGRHRLKIFDLQYGPGSKVECHQGCDSS